MFFFWRRGGRGNTKGACGPTCFLESWVLICLAPSGEPESSNLSVPSIKGGQKGQAEVSLGLVANLFSKDTPFD